MKWPVHHKSRHKDKTLFFICKEMQVQKEAALRFISSKAARHLCHFIAQNAPFHRVFCVILSCEMSQITRPFAPHHFTIDEDKNNRL